MDYTTSAPVFLDEIPTELRDRDQWIDWRDENGRKLPYAATGGMASSTDPTTWTSFDVAVEAYRNGTFTGVGFVFSSSDPFVGIDLDGCRDPETGVIEPWAQEVIEACGGTYSEVSPSRTGVKLIGVGSSPFPAGKNAKLPQHGSLGGKAAGLEIYDHGRFFTITGWRLPDADREPCVIPDGGLALIKRIIDDAGAAKRSTPPPRLERHHSATDDRAKLVERCRRYVARMPGAISGQGGHDATFNVACTMFRFGLTDDEAAGVLAEYSGRCEPPWSDRELQHKLDSARERVTAAGEFGSMARDDWSGGPAVDLSGIMRHSATSSAGGQVEHDDEPEPERRPFTFYAARDLLTSHPTMKPYIVDDLLRRNETANLIAAPKLGKSWLALSLALSVAAGKAWLDAFPTATGSVLIVDNELHPETLSARVAKLAASLGIDLDEVGDRLVIAPLRGMRVTYSSLWRIFAQCQRQRFALTILDAGYRFLEPDQSENENGDVLQNYNLLDELAAQHDTAFVVVHHTSKGGQGDKATTDIGAGAGAQSRAADTHIALIPHDSPEAVVMKVARRSGKAPEDRVLRRNPETLLWEECRDLDPSETAGSEIVRARKSRSKAEKQREEEETENLARLRNWWRAHPGEYSEKQLRDRAGIVNAQSKVPRLLAILEGKGYVTAREGKSGTRTCVLYSYQDKPGAAASDDCGPRPYAGFEDGNW